MQVSGAVPWEVPVTSTGMTMLERAVGVTSTGLTIGAGGPRDKHATTPAEAAPASHLPAAAVTRYPGSVDLHWN